jgi:hypothetical protein
VVKNSADAKQLNRRKKGMKRIASGSFLSREFHDWIQAQGVEIAWTNLMLG